MNRWWLIGLGIAMFVAVCLSPFASSDPDGLNKVAQDHGFQQKAVASPAQQLPFAQVFQGYTLRGVDNPILTKGLAGAGGILVVLAGVWGLGWWLQKRRSNP